MQEGGDKRECDDVGGGGCYCKEHRGGGERKEGRGGENDWGRGRKHEGEGEFF